MQKTIQITQGGFVIKLDLPDESKDLKFSQNNNISAYNLKGELVWNIADLLADYSERKGLEYYEEQYFDVNKCGSNMIYCVGFVNHCLIDLDDRAIVALINNR